MTVVLVVPGIELASRFIHQGRAPLLPYIYREGAPSLPPDTEIHASFYGRPPNHYAMDARGARVAGHPAANRAARDGVFVVGDSQVLGYMLEFRETFASRLAGALAGDPVAARILAAPTMDPEKALTRVDQYFSGPTERQRLAVVSLNLGNDLDEMFNEGPIRGGTWGPVRSWLTSNSFLYMDLILIRSHRLSPGQQPFGVNPILYALSAGERVVLAEQAVATVVELVERLRDFDEVVVLVIPTDIEADPAEFSKYRIYYDSDGEFEKWRSKAAMLGRMMRVLDRYVTQRLRSRGITVVSLIDALPARHDLPLFDQTSHHITAATHEIIAGEILKTIDPRLREGAPNAL